MTSPTKQTEMAIAWDRLAEEELISLSRTGQPRAYGELILRYQDRLFNTVLRVVGNYDDALEITQESFVKAFQNLGRFRGSSSFYTWLFRIGMNLSLNLRRRQGKVTFVSIDAAMNHDQDQAAGLAELAAKDHSDPGELAQAQEEYQRIIAALDQLEPDARVPLVLRDIEQLSYAEIGKLLEIPLGTVKSRIARARMTLREKLLYTERS